MPNSITPYQPNNQIVPADDIIDAEVLEEIAPYNRQQISHYKAARIEKFYGEPVGYPVGQDEINEPSKRGGQYLLVLFVPLVLLILVGMLYFSIPILLHIPPVSTPVAVGTWIP